MAGRTLTLNGRIVSIVGVVRDGFQGPGGLYEPDVWVPLDRMQVLNLPARRLDRSEAWLTVVGRMSPGVSAAQAGTDLQSVAAALAADHPATNKQRSLAFAPMVEGNPEVRSLAPVGWIALAIVGVVLLIACFNVAALLLARAADRQREIGVRTALGASRGRILRQFAMEGLMLALVSGAAAIVIAGWSADLLSAFSLPSPIPQRLHIGVDRRLVGFTVMLVALAGIVPSLLPALQATRINLVASMRMETALGPRRSRLRNTFMIAQIAGSTLFVTAALLFLRSFWTQAGASPGFETAHLLVLELKPTDYDYDAPRSRALFDHLVERVGALPGVERVAIGDRIPFYVGFPKVTRLSAEGADCGAVECPNVPMYGIGPGYMAALGVPMFAGRDFTQHELTAGDSVIVSQKLASRLWPGRPAVGESVRETPSGRQLRVVGVAADIKHHMLSEAPREYLYRPMVPAQFGDTVTLIVRTSGDPGALLSTVQDQVRALDPKLPPGSARTMAQRMEMPLWPARTAAGFLGICGTLALTLATVGLFGMTYLTVSQRTREFGIRAAIGATPRRVMGLVLREGHLADGAGSRAGPRWCGHRRATRVQRAVRSQPGRPVNLRCERRAAGSRRARRLPAAGASSDEGRSDARAAGRVGLQFGADGVTEFTAETRSARRRAHGGRVASRRRWSRSPARDLVHRLSQRPSSAQQILSARLPLVSAPFLRGELRYLRPLRHQHSRFRTELQPARRSPGAWFSRDYRRPCRWC